MVKNVNLRPNAPEAGLMTAHDSSSPIPFVSAHGDNDLLVVYKNITPAVGEVTYLSGRILDARGEPIRNAPSRNLASRPTRGLPALSDQKCRQEGRELPGLRPIPDDIDRRVPISQSKTGRLSGPYPPYSYGDPAARRRAVRDACVCGRRAEKLGRWFPSRHS